MSWRRGSLRASSGKARRAIVLSKSERKDGFAAPRGASCCVAKDRAGRIEVPCVEAERINSISCRRNNEKCKAG